MSDPSFPLVQPHRQPLFDLDGFDRAISSQPGGKGVALVHYRAMRCPAGLDSPGDQRRSHEDHSGCSGGYLFRKAGLISALFSGNSTQQRSNDPGFIASSTGSITFSRFYEGTEQPVRVSQFDRLFLPDEAVLVETWELFQHDPAGDRLRFPVAEVVDLVTASNQWLVPGDFAVVDGRLEWGFGRRPTLRPDGRGEVCCARYLYRPFWFVSYLHHDLRLVTQDRLQEDGSPSRTVAVYQACSVQREYFFKTEDNDPEAGFSSRQAPPPAGPQFGPR